MRIKYKILLVGTNPFCFPAARLAPVPAQAPPVPEIFV